MQNAANIAVCVHLTSMSRVVYVVYMCDLLSGKRRGGTALLSRPTSRCDVAAAMAVHVPVRYQSGSLTCHTSTLPRLVLQVHACGASYLKSAQTQQSI